KSPAPIMAPIPNATKFVALKVRLRLCSDSFACSFRSARVFFAKSVSAIHTPDRPQIAEFRLAAQSGPALRRTTIGTNPPERNDNTTRSELPLRGTPSGAIRPGNPRLDSLDQRDDARSAGASAANAIAAQSKQNQSPKRV